MKAAASNFCLLLLLLRSFLPHRMLQGISMAQGTVPPAYSRGRSAFLATCYHYELAQAQPISTGELNFRSGCCRSPLCRGSSFRTIQSIDLIPERRAGERALVSFLPSSSSSSSFQRLSLTHIVTDTRKVFVVDVTFRLASSMLRCPDEVRQAGVFLITKIGAKYWVNGCFKMFRYSACTSWVSEHFEATFDP